MMLTDIKHEYGVTPGATSGHSSITSGLRSPTQQQNSHSQGGQPSKQYIVLPRCRPANRAPIRKRRMENTNNNNSKNTMKVKYEILNPRKISWNFKGGDTIKFKSEDWSKCFNQKRIFGFNNSTRKYFFNPLQFHFERNLWFVSNTSLSRRNYHHNITLFIHIIFIIPTKSIIFGF